MEAGGGRPRRTDGRGGRRVLKSIFASIRKRPVLWLVGLVLPALASFAVNFGFSLSLNAYTAELTGRGRCLPQHPASDGRDRRLAGVRRHRRGRRAAYLLCLYRKNAERRQAGDVRKHRADEIRRPRRYETGARFIPCTPAIRRRRRAFPPATCSVSCSRWYTRSATSSRCSPSMRSSAQSFRR